MLTRVPSKTFLLGEYVVLDGGPCLILTTPPYFELSCEPSNFEELSVAAQGIHPQSPAGKWLNQHADFFKNYHLHFFDPHQGKGGFGASGAQFIGVYQAIHSIQRTICSIESLLKAYWEMFPQRTQVLPSGADLVAQIVGKITYWHRSEKKFAGLEWPFEDLCYCLIHTGQKQTTHQNLQRFSPAVMAQMAKIVEDGYAAFRSKDTLGFIDAIAQYARWMKQEKRLVANSEAYINFLERSCLIEAAKGCGAMGADVILVLVRPEKLQAFSCWLKERQIAFII